MELEANSVRVILVPRFVDTEPRLAIAFYPERTCRKRTPRSNPAL